MLLTRGVLYTAITRARELFIIVGDERVVAKMAANDRQQRRYSGLRARLANPRFFSLSPVFSLSILYLFQVRFQT